MIKMEHSHCQNFSFMSSGNDCLPWYTTKSQTTLSGFAITNSVKHSGFCLLGTNYLTGQVPVNGTIILSRDKLCILYCFKQPCKTCSRNGLNFQILSAFLWSGLISLSNTTFIFDRIKKSLSLLIVSAINGTLNDFSQYILIFGSCIAAMT